MPIAVKDTKSEKRQILYMNNNLSILLYIVVDKFNWSIMKLPSHHNRVDLHDCVWTVKADGGGDDDDDADDDGDDETRYVYTDFNFKRSVIYPFSNIDTLMRAEVFQTVYKMKLTIC